MEQPESVTNKVMWQNLIEKYEATITKSQERPKCPKRASYGTENGPP
jgi:hypothetical protein